SKNPTANPLRTKPKSSSRFPASITSHASLPMARIGVISDTHNFLDPKIPPLLKGIDHIFHAGDIGMPWLILQLEEIAPVTAVLGNTDDSGLHFKQMEIIELAGRKFLIHHIVNP